MINKQSTTSEPLDFNDDSLNSKFNETIKYAFMVKLKTMNYPFILPLRENDNDNLKVMINNTSVENGNHQDFLAVYLYNSFIFSAPMSNIEFYYKKMLEH